MTDNSPNVVPLGTREIPRCVDNILASSEELDNLPVCFTVNMIPLLSG